MKRPSKPAPASAAAPLSPAPESTPGTDSQSTAAANGQQPQLHARAGSAAVSGGNAFTDDSNAQTAPQQQSAGSADTSIPADQPELNAQQQQDREQRIREAAYDHYLKRNGGPGDADSDWRAAEELLANTDPHPSTVAP